MNPLDSLFGNPVQRIDAILSELFPAIQDDLRREKCSLIDSVIRGLKFASQFDSKAQYCTHWDNLPQTFDRLYELDLDVLEAYSKALDKHNTNYMRDNVEKNNRADWNKPDFDIWR